MSELEVFTVNETVDLGRDFSAGYVFTFGQLRSLVAVLSGVLSIICQPVVVLIGRGLPQDFSAGTFLMAQATADMWRRITSLQQPLCFTLGQH